MKLLAIDTSSDAIGIGYYDGQMHTKITTPDPKTHNKTLLADIDDMLNENGVQLSDIDYFGVVIGPGSFTGIRIGVATINAFAMATKKPVVEIISLEQLADGTDKMVLLDCKHNNYYVGIYQNGCASYHCMKIDEIEKSDMSKEYLLGVLPEKMLLTAVQKVEKGEYVKKAKPFYIKASSAETGE